MKLKTVLLSTLLGAFMFTGCKSGEPTENGNGKANSEEKAAPKAEEKAAPKAEEKAAPKADKE